MILADNKTHVGTLRVRVDRSEVGGVRQAVAAQLQAADLRPSALPPSAILVVRRIADPLPRHVSSQTGSLALDRRWEAAARGALALAYRQAARPSREVVPANAEAVVFQDDAEMLACLALDVSRGHVRERWWWRTLPRAWTTAQPEALQAVFCDRPAVVPAALHWLGRRGDLWTVVGYLRQPQVERVLAAVSWAFGAPRIAFDGGANLTGPGRGDVPGEGVSQASKAGGVVIDPPPSVASAEPAEAVPAPWETWLPAAIVPASATRETVCLVGVALGLLRSPAVARSAAFAAAARTWLYASPRPAPSQGSRDSSASDLPRRHSPPPNVQPADPPNLGGRDPRSEFSDHRIVPVVRQSSERSGEDPSRQPVGLVSQPTDPTITPIDRRSARPSSKPPQTPMDPAAPIDLGRGEPHGIGEDAAGARLIHVARSADDQTSAQEIVPLGVSPATSGNPARSVAPRAWDEAVRIPALAGGVTTGLGGVLYLINLMVYLDLPDCFEAEWELGTRVGPWGVLELLGRALIRRRTADFQDDPLWLVLAELDGRPAGTLPRAPRPPMPPWSLPGRWSDLAEGRALRRGVRRGKMVGGVGASRPLLASVADPAQEWLDLVEPYIRACLRRSLSVGPGRRLNLETALLRRAGRLYWSDLHVDLVLPLDEVSIAVRLAGLDIDPGWLPGFGRVVKFHYE